MGFPRTQVSESRWDTVWTRELGTSRHEPPRIAVARVWAVASSPAGLSQAQLGDHLGWRGRAGRVRQPLMREVGADVHAWASTRCRASCATRTVRT